MKYLFLPPAFIRRFLVLPVVLLLFGFSTALGGRWYIRSQAGSDSHTGQSWSEALATLDAALDSCLSGDTLLVGERSPFCPDTLTGGVEIGTSCSIWGVAAADTLAARAGGSRFVIVNDPMEANTQDLLVVRGEGVQCRITGVDVIGNYSGSSSNWGDRLIWAADTSQLLVDNATASYGTIGFAVTKGAQLTVTNSEANGNTVGFWANVAGSSLTARDCVTRGNNNGYSSQNLADFSISQCQSFSDNTGISIPSSSPTSGLELDHLLIADASIALSLYLTSSKDSLALHHLTIVDCVTGVSIGQGIVQLDRSVLTGITTLASVSGGSVYLGQSLAYAIASGFDDVVIIEPMLYLIPRFVHPEADNWALRPGSPGDRCWGLPEPLGAFPRPTTCDTRWSRGQWMRLQ